jgi:hypothetical protein
MPQQRRKTSLRRAAGTVQDQFLGRMRELKEDPTIVLPECPVAEPRVLAQLRGKLERLREGKVGFLDRFDRGIFGAARESVKLADRTEQTVLLDAKIAGTRRFYLQRGQINRGCTLGVQNHDQPRVLILAYAEMAKKAGLHFFAGTDVVWCTGATPLPPAEWFGALTGEALELHAETSEEWGCGHTDRHRVLLEFRGGPTIAACGNCGAKVEGLHKRLRERYVGPQQRQPVEVKLLHPDGTLHEPAREPLAKYRAGLLDEDGLLKAS